MAAVDQAGGQWTFTAQVAAEFDQHVASSVPFYTEIQALVAQCADWALPDGSTFADIGASTGTTSAAIAKRHANREIRHVLYDLEPPMLDKARAKLQGVDAEYHAVDLTREPMRHSDAGLTVALFTLQFLGEYDRLRVLREARAAAKPGGMLIVAEKLREADSRWHEIAAELSWDKKLGAGLSAEHVVIKAASLRGVLRPLDDLANRTLIEAAGWSSVEVIFRWQQWCVYGAFAGLPGDVYANEWANHDA